MKLSLQLLEAHVDSAPAEHRGPMTRSLTAALREVDSLTRLAGQFSQYARLPEPSFETIDLLELARGSGALLGDGPVSVRSDPGTTAVRADPVLVSRALGNLLLNAREASAPDSPIEVVVVPGDGAVEIQVLDRGAGLPSDLRDRLFEPYVSTKKRGSGLGLSLVRDIARQHSGTVTLEDRPGGGTRAALTLPRDPIAAGAPAHGAARS
jgi:two-component system nitrogen regulation sensor histidine kinase NtrY